MARDILSEFGPESRQPQAPRASGGGQMQPRDVMNYKPPQGPMGMMHSGPGLGGTNCGNAGTQNCNTAPRSSGSPGIGGNNHGAGTNRRG